MNLTEKQQEIIDEFSVYEDWMDKYEYIIDLGKDLPEIDEALKTPERLIDGCQSKVWLVAEEKEGKVHYRADSNTDITKGLISLLIRVLNHRSPKEILEANLDFIPRIGMGNILGSQRSNGLAAMMNQMKRYALAFQTKQNA